MKSIKKYISMFLVILMTFAFISCEIVTDESLTKLIEEGETVSITLSTGSTALPDSIIVTLTNTETGESVPYTASSANGYTIAVPTGTYTISYAPADTTKGIFSESYSLTIEAGNPVTQTVYPFTISEFTLSEPVNGTVSIIGYTGTDATLYIPNVINGNTVTGLGNGSASVLTDNTSVTSIIVPDSVTTLADNAFTGNTTLTSASFAGNVYIGASAFYNSTSLTKATFNGSVSSIGSDAFYGWSDEQEIWFKGNETATDDIRSLSTDSDVKASIKIGSNGVDIDYSGVIWLQLENVPSDVVVTLSIKAAGSDTVITTMEFYSTVYSHDWTFAVGDYTYTATYSGDNDYGYSVKDGGFSVERNITKTVTAESSCAYGVITISVSGYEAMAASAAKVTMTATEKTTEAVVTADLSGDGDYTVSLPAGTYTLTYSATDFATDFELSRTKEDTDVVVEAGSPSSLEELTISDAYIISTADEFLAFLTELQTDDFSNQNIVKLANNISLNNMDITDYKASNFAGTFDGCGYTLSDFKTSNTGLFGTVTGTIQNLTIDNAESTPSSMDAGILAHYLNYGGYLYKVIVKNSSIISSSGEVGGIVGYSYANPYDSTKGATISYCSVIDTIVSGTDRVGGIVGGQEEAYNIVTYSTVTLNTGYSITATKGNAGGISGLNLYGSGINNCTVTLNGTATINGTTSDYSTGAAAGIAAEDQDAVLTDNKVIVASTAGLYSNGEVSKYYISAYTYCNDVYSNNTYNGTVFAGGNQDWTVTKNIYTADEFVDFLQNSASYSDTYTLIADIDLSGNTFASDTKNFSGILDGNGHKITGYTNTAGYGLFFTLNGTVKNLVIDKAKITNAQNESGIVTGYHYGTIDSVIVKNSSIAYASSSKANIGAIAGHAGSAASSAVTSSITNCKVINTDVSSYMYSGGIVGRIGYGSNSITDCIVYLGSGHSIVSAGQTAGGIAAAARTSATVTGNTVILAGSDARISATSNAAGILYNPASGFTFTNNNVYVDIEGGANILNRRTSTTETITYPITGDSATESSGTDNNYYSSIDGASSIIDSISSLIE